MPASRPFTHAAVGASNGAPTGSMGTPARAPSRSTPVEEAVEVATLWFVECWRGAQQPDRARRGATHRSSATRRRPARCRAGRAAALRRGDPRQRDRAHLERRLEGERIDGVGRDGVDAGVLAVQVVPVERGEAAAREHAVGHHRGQHGTTAPRRHLDRGRRRRCPAARRRRDGSRRTVPGRAWSSLATLPVLVIVCHWCASRPVLNVNGKSSSGGSAAGPWARGWNAARPFGVANASRGTCPSAAVTIGRCSPSLR